MKFYVTGKSRSCCPVGHVACHYSGLGFVGGGMNTRVLAEVRGQLCNRVSCLLPPWCGSVHWAHVTRLTTHTLLYPPSCLTSPESWLLLSSLFSYCTYYSGLELRLTAGRCIINTKQVIPEGQYWHNQMGVKLNSSCLQGRLFWLLCLPSPSPFLVTSWQDAATHWNSSGLDCRRKLEIYSLWTVPLMTSELLILGNAFLTMCFPLLLCTGSCGQAGHV